MRRLPTKIAIVLTSVLVLAAALVPAAASASTWTLDGKNHGSFPRFNFNLNVGPDHTSVTELRLFSPCVLKSGWFVLQIPHAGHVEVGSQAGLYYDRTSSLSFRAETGGLHFSLRTHLTPGSGFGVVGLHTHATLSTPGVCHEELEFEMHADPLR